MHIGSAFPGIVSRLEQEISRLCTFHIRNFPYHTKVKGSRNEDGRHYYSFAWSLDKGGYEIVSKLVCEFLPDTYDGYLMMRVQPSRMRRDTADWDDPYNEGWRYDKWIIMAADPLMIITLLEAHVNHDKLVEQVHAT